MIELVKKISVFHLPIMKVHEALPFCTFLDSCDMYSLYVEK
jgi:hypothetical protein